MTTTLYSKINGLSVERQKHLESFLAYLLHEEEIEKQKASLQTKLSRGLQEVEDHLQGKIKLPTWKEFTKTLGA